MTSCATRSRNVILAIHRRAWALAPRSFADVARAALDAAVWAVAAGRFLTETLLAEEHNPGVAASSNAPMPITAARRKRFNMPSRLASDASLLDETKGGLPSSVVNHGCFDCRRPRVNFR